MDDLEIHVNNKSSIINSPKKFKPSEDAQPKTKHHAVLSWEWWKSSKI